MVIKAKTFTKLKNKINSKIIGTYNSSNGLGNNIIINEYLFTKNTRSDKIYTGSGTTTIPETPDSFQQIKGVIFDGSDYQLNQALNLKINDKYLNIFVPIDTIVEDTETKHYEFTINNIVYILEKSFNIGSVANISGIIKLIALRRKNDFS
jgi:hypothetical protein